MKNRQSGFTLIELLVVVAVASVLMSLAVPSFRTFLVKRSMQAAVDALVLDMRFARSEAIKRTTRVSICSSTNGTACALAASWKDGWIIFIDDDGDGVVDGSDVVLRVQDSFSNLATLSTSATTLAIVYQPAGWARAAAQTFTFTPTGDGASRLVCVSNQGRASSRAEGATSCS
jgi:type IV fimbrial biogenesis protein FimT